MERRIRRAAKRTGRRIAKKREYKRLNQRSIESLAPGRMHADGDNLYLDKDPSGASRWIWQKVLAGKQRSLGGGGTRHVSLAEARIWAAELNAQVHRGVDPTVGRKAVGAHRKPAPPPAVAGKTFGDCIIEYATSKGSEWRSERHRNLWGVTLGVQRESIRNKLVNGINISDVLGVLEPMWARTPETGKRVRGRIAAVLSYAQARGYRPPGENPAAWKDNLSAILPKRGKLDRGHFAAMRFEDLPEFMNRLRRIDSVAALALGFAIHTAGRVSEVRGATWHEVEAPNSMWSIPAGRMKAAEIHRVPLTDEALDILARAAAIRSNHLVFPGRADGKSLPINSLTRLLKSMGVEATCHGMRSSFRVWAAERTSFPREIAESALAHQVGSAVERAYARTDFYDRRRQLMQAWSRFLCGGNEL